MRASLQVGGAGAPAGFSSAGRCPRAALAPGGHLLLGGHAGDARLHPAEAYGHPVSYASHLVPADRLAGLLAEAGFAVTTRLEQPHPQRADRSHLCLLAHRRRR
ncbi:hypothetical protein ACIPLC_33985 [Kitasatospora sp. NPDC086801]|uniref:hypothetical protein n=1 Tax=Kitasatospora sp. NPDC086801 TaxID=3364066 RepID=UPI0038227809